MVINEAQLLEHFPLLPPAPPALPPRPPTQPVDLTNALSTAGATATASSVYQSFEASEAFDGDANNYWHSGGDREGQDEWLQIQLTAPAVVAAYRFTARPDACCAAADSPHAWTLEGSNDGSTWTALHTAIGEEGWGAGEARTYHIPGGDSYSQMVPYEYYKWTQACLGLNP